MWCVRTRSSAPRRLCRDGALHQSLGVDPVITPAYHRVRKNTGVIWSDRNPSRSSGSRTVFGFSVTVFRLAGSYSARPPLLRNFAGGEASPFFSESGKSPSHVGNTGSNPVGGANNINYLKTHFHAFPKKFP